MPHATTQAFTDHLQALFDGGTCAGLTDGDLVERFQARRDEGGERAFEALVTRYGPMVLRVCRNLLDDPNDVHDAFQAVFLVLARRAGAIRESRSVGSWLYGVAVRVAARARVSTIRRRIRDRRTIEAAGVVAAVACEPRSGPLIEHDDGAAVVHQEVNRLPEKYRAPVVLCYLEGLTHDEAAARLSWPVGTVRSRLSRARDTLRSRLTRRGVTAPAVLGPLATWLVGNQAASSAVAATAAGFPTALPVHLPTSLARAVTRLAAGQSAAAGSWSAASLALAHGVLKAMLLKKLTIVACALLPFGIAAIGGGVILVRASRAQETRPAPAAAPNQTTKPVAKPDPAKSDDIDPLLRQLLEAARQRIEAQRAYYEEGRITIDRFIDACAHLEKVQLLAAKTEDQRRSVRQRHLDLLKEIENREEAEVQVGRGTVADVAEARQRRLEAEFELKISEKEASETASLLRRLSELERKVDQLQRERDEPKTSRQDLHSIQSQTLLESITDLSAERPAPRP